MDKDGFLNLHGKVILITGGNGIYGRGLVRDVAACGATVITASRDCNASERTVAEERQLGRDVHSSQLDIGSEDSILALKADIQARFGRLDGLVNNAVARPLKGAGSAAEFAESMRINATGLYLMHHHLGDWMAAQGQGSIVNVGSIQGMIGPSFRLYIEGESPAAPPPDYFFHKGGMINLTRYYASHLGRSGVRVNCLSPGGFQEGAESEFTRRYARQTLLGRMAGGHDLSGPVIFLLSNASAYITGVNLPVDGGYTAV